MKSRFKKNWTTTEQNSSAVRPCDFPGCCGAGEYRAPKSRDHLRDYYWFCLDHVREYNKAWDYYAGLKPEEIEEAIRSDTTWHRPTWRLGANSASSRQKFGFRIDDPLGVFDDDGHAPPPTPRVSSAEEEAMTVLGLEPPLTQSALRARYKELVKRHHPDANGGAKEAEERFKQISQAYTLLMASLGAA